MSRAPKTSETDELFTNTVYLDFPAKSDIGRAYRDLPARGRALVTCRLAEMAVVLRSLEEAGFFGMRIGMPGSDGHAARVSAYKGKEGACHDTGRTAVYKGSAAAALDDDSHLLVGETRICEKTAAIYASPVYAEAVDVSAGEEALLARLGDDPVAFDCDGFEADAAKLASSLVGEQGEEDAAVAILYPGPFRLLVLRDGTVLRRGQAILIRRKDAQRLVKEDGCTADPRAADAVSPVNFVEAYQAEGPLFLLGEAALGGTFHQTDEVHMDALLDVPKRMASRLRKMIERADGYFILTGSDPRDEFGCCPSDDVGVANRLVEAGILHSWHPPSAPDSCSSTVYAFAGEIHSDGPKPRFTVNGDLRRTVSDRLGQAEAGRRRLPLLVARWSLFIFVATSIGFVLLDEISKGTRVGRPGAAAEGGRARGADLPLGNAVLVRFFHPSERCDFCVVMEMHTRKALSRHFGSEVRGGKVVFRELNIDSPANRDLVEWYGVFGSSVVLVRITNGSEGRWKLLTDAWRLAGSEEEFAEMIRAELTDFLEDTE